MAGVVLALAGLTCGDGGAGIGAATAPLAVSLDGDMEGKWGEGTRIELRRGVLTIYTDFEYVLFAYSVRADGEGKVRITDYGGRSWQGTYRHEGQYLLICWDMWPDAPRPIFLLVKLRPAPLRKP